MTAQTTVIAVITPPQKFQRWAPAAVIAAASR